jgi:hypothetical protein
MTQQPTATGGGAPMKGVEASGGGSPAPEPPAPATTEVTGGGAAAATCYAPNPEPQSCGQWVPAPVVVGGDTPPAPIEAPGADPAATAEPAASGPASDLPTWPQWSQHFVRLGLSPQELTKLGAAELDDAQLAEVYEQLHGSIVESGGIPGESPLPAPGASGAWDAEWDQRFAQLGLPADFVAQLRDEAQRRGAGDQEIARVYEQVVAKIEAAQQQGTPVGTPQATPGTTPGTVPGTTPQGEQPAAGADEQPGWNAQIEQSFRALGMPDEVIQLYAQSGAPASGLEAAYRHAAGRLQDFTDRGWAEKFTAAGVPPLTTWSLILGDEPAKDDALQGALRGHEHSKEGLLQKGGEIATSLFPGGHLLKYVFGRDLNGDAIDRTSPMQIGMAALSGLAAFAAIRGGKNVMAGIAARNNNFSALNGVSGTLAELGLPKGGVEAMEQAAMGATQTWGAKQKIMAFIPGTKLHREVVGLGHAEAAARAFNTGGAAKILANDADGALQLATITQLFDEIKSGAVRVHGGANAYLGPFKKAPMMSLGTARDGAEVIKVAKNLRIGANGNAQLIGLMEMGGQKLGSNPAWLSNATNLVDDVTNLAQAEQQTLGRVMAGNLAQDLGELGRPGFKPERYIRSLVTNETPDWYRALGQATKGQWPAAQIPAATLELLSAHRVYTGLFDDAAAAIAKLDRSALTPEAAQLLDDVVARTDDLRGALDASRAAGAATSEVNDALVAWDRSLVALAEVDPDITLTAFGRYFNQSDWTMAFKGAEQAVRSEWAAQAATLVDDVAGAADDVAGAAGDVADDLVRAMPSSTGDASRGASIASELLEPATPTRLTVNARGEAVTPTGLIIPSYASPVGSAIPRSVDDPAVARLAAAMQQVRG